MGEYALYKGERIKIGTCEDMYYLRADQIHLVTALPGNVDPLRHAERIRFRFPFPGEDNVEPGDFGNHSRTLGLYGIDMADMCEHGTAQFTSNYPRKGYVVSLPCPESRGGQALEASGIKIGRNGYSGSFHIVQQRVWDGMLVLVGECGGCGNRFRLETLEDCAVVLDNLEAQALSEENGFPKDEGRARYWRNIAERISQGYTNPPAWVAR